MPAIGLTTSIPIEVLVAADKKPMDLNNQFISRPDTALLLEEAERRGFPAACCAWIKGIYATVLTLDLEEVIAVVYGDCSQTRALMEVFQMEGFTTYPFAYPEDRSLAAMKDEIQKLQSHFGVNDARVADAKQYLDQVRTKLRHLDEMTWKENQVQGKENHEFLVASSDMRGDPAGFEIELDLFLEKASARRGFGPDGEIRLGYLGVPPIWSDFYDKVERPGVRIVFNEIQRQFSMPYATRDLAEQYTMFTYPYDVFSRVKDVQTEVKRRRLDGFIHYAQSFCFRQIEDKIFRHYLDTPILTLQGDGPEPLDARSQVRLEAFLEVLAQEKPSDWNGADRN